MIRFTLEMSREEAMQLKIALIMGQRNTRDRLDDEDGKTISSMNRRLNLREREVTTHRAIVELDKLTHPDSWTARRSG